MSLGKHGAPWLLTSLFVLVSIYSCIHDGSIAHADNAAPTPGVATPAKQPAATAEYWRLVERGNSFRGLGRDQDATQSYSQAIALDPGIYWGWFNRGLTKRVSKDLAGAATDFAKAADVDPTDPDAPRLLGITLRQLNKGAEALSAFNRSIAARPTADAYVERSAYYSDTLAYKEAVADATEALKLGAKSAHLFNLRGYARRHLGDEAGANTDFESALSVSETPAKTGK